MKKTFALIVSVLASLIHLDAQVAINNAGQPPHPSAGLDISFPDKGILPPRMTTSERIAVSSPAAGLQIYNTDKNCIEFYTGTEWRDLCGQTACDNPPANAPSAGTHIPGATYMIWNWNAVSGATGYKYNTVNDYASASNSNGNTTYTQTGLSCGEIPVSLYVWAVNACGNSTPVELTSATLECPFVCGSSSITVEHVAGDISPVGKTVTYGTVSFDGMCWITRNLGASSTPSSATDNSESAGGWFWQFNRKQGYEHTGITSSDVLTPSWTITSINEPSGWTATEDPCLLLLGEGWHIPTDAQWTSAVSSWSNHFDAFSSTLAMHSAGALDTNNGTIYGRGQLGEYWSSSKVDGEQGNYDGRSVGFGDGYNGNWNNNKAGGKSLRCAKD